MQKIKIYIYNHEIHFDYLKLLVQGHQSFMQTLEPDMAVSAPNKFDLNEYLKYFDDMRVSKIIYLAFVDNEAAGYISNYCSVSKSISVYRVHRYACLNELYVAEKFRKMGVATRLIKKSIEWAKSEKCEYIQVGYASHNKEAKKLYNSRMKFKTLGQYSRKNI